MKRFQCYSAQKSFMGGGWCRHCNYSYKLQVQVSWRFEIDLGPGPEVDNYTYVEFIRNQRLKAFLTFQKYKTSVRSYYISSSHGTLICRTDSLETWSWLNVFCSVDGDYSLVRVTGDGVGKQQTASSSHNRHLADGPTKEEH